LYFNTKINYCPANICWNHLNITILFFYTFVCIDNFCANTTLMTDNSTEDPPACQLCFSGFMCIHLCMLVERWLAPVRHSFVVCPSACFLALLSRLKDLNAYSVWRLYRVSDGTRMHARLIARRSLSIEQHTYTQCSTPSNSMQNREERTAWERSFSLLVVFLWSEMDGGERRKERRQTTATTTSMMICMCMRMCACEYKFAFLASTIRRLTPSGSFGLRILYRIVKKANERINHFLPVH
jgi:hypothetical protein